MWTKSLSIREIKTIEQLHDMSEHELFSYMHDLRDYGYMVETIAKYRSAIGEPRIVLSTKTEEEE
jgi:hypothetical protein